MEIHTLPDDPPAAPGPTPAAIKAARHWRLRFEWGGRVVELLDVPDVDTAAWLAKAALLRLSGDGEHGAPFG